MPEAMARHKVVHVTCTKMIILEKLLEQRWVVVKGVFIVREVLPKEETVNPGSELFNGH